MVVSGSGFPISACEFVFGVSVGSGLGTGAATGLGVEEGVGVGMAQGSSSLVNHGIAVTTSAGAGLA